MLKHFLTFRKQHKCQEASIYESGFKESVQTEGMFIVFCQNESSQSDVDFNIDLARVFEHYA